MSADRFSLFLDLEEGQKADLEVTARASIALTETIREISEFIDPLSKIKLELIDSTEGSLFLNLRVKLFGSSSQTRKTLIAMFLAASAYLGANAGDFVEEKLLSQAWEHFFGPDEAHLSEDDRKDIAKMVADTLAAKAGQRPSQKLYRELGHDPAVKGVGVTPKSESRPAHIVPRSEFSLRGGLTSTEQTSRRRTKIEIEKVVLVSPVLVSGKRRWKFRSHNGEFGASIKDENFLESVLSGQTPIAMKRNVEMTVEMEVTEEFKNGIWVVVRREIIRIVGVPTQSNIEQSSFSLEK